MTLTNKEKQAAFRQRQKAKAAEQAAELARLRQQSSSETRSESRVISLEMTWTHAAHIIAAALENGTGEGKRLARAELFRMAAALDTMQKKADPL
jgi:hypothetical protein